MHRLRNFASIFCAHSFSQLFSLLHSHNLVPQIPRHGLKATRLQPIFTTPGPLKTASPKTTSKPFKRVTAIFGLEPTADSLVLTASNLRSLIQETIPVCAAIAFSVWRKTSAEIFGLAPSMAASPVTVQAFLQPI